MVVRRKPGLSPRCRAPGCQAAFAPARRCRTACPAPLVGIRWPSIQPRATPARWADSLWRRALWRARRARPVAATRARDRRRRAICWWRPHPPQRQCPRPSRRLRRHPRPQHPRPRLRPPQRPRHPSRAGAHCRAHSTPRASRTVDVARWTSACCSGRATRPHPRRRRPNRPGVICLCLNTRSASATAGAAAARRARSLWRRRTVWRPRRSPRSRPRPSHLSWRPSLPGARCRSASTERVSRRADAVRRGRTGWEIASSSANVTRPHLHQRRHRALRRRPRRAWRRRPRRRPRSRHGAHSLPTSTASVWAVAAAVKVQCASSLASATRPRPCLLQRPARRPRPCQRRHRARRRRWCRARR